MMSILIRYWAAVVILGLTSALTSPAEAAKIRVDVRGVMPQIFGRCVNGQATELSVMDSEGPSRSRDLRVVTYRVPSGGRIWGLSSEASTLDFELSQGQQVSLVQRGGIFRKSKSVVLGRFAPGALDDVCRRSNGSRGLRAFNSVEIELNASLDLDLTVDLSDRCESRTQWPNGNGRSFHRDSVFIHRFTDRQTGVSIEYRQSQEYGYADEASCQKGGL